MFPSLYSERFLLRKIINQDKPKIFEGLSDERVNKFYGVSFATLESVDEQLRFYDNLLDADTGIWWGICFKDDPLPLIGACGLNNWSKKHRRIEIGFWLLPENMNRHVMSECLPLIIEYAFSKLNVHRIEALIEAGNEASVKLVSKLGFYYEGTLKDYEIKNERFIDLQYYSLIENAF